VAFDRSTEEDMMLKQLTHVNVWVTDQDDALAFYTEKLGFELRDDVTVPEMGNFRWLTVGVPGQQDVALALLPVPGPPVFDEETKATLEELVAKGAAGGLFFSTDDCRASYEELKARGVEFSQEPTEQPYGIDAGFRDPFGNQIRMAQVA
jgi:catechol 2,3-dioxygenase-like lactoylglutathione lyase family enzyme